ncbi:MAG: DUF429 domain-containing protein, partial [Bdellovibrionales bacterium]|nr:DUF429 domain-containing protein [Bdellovibrionales bacterium]
TPYTQRSVEFWLQDQKEETFPMDSALGSNGAPLLARAKFLNRQLSLPSSEVFVPLSVMRIGNQLGVGKSFLKTYKHSIHGQHSRSEVLRTIVEAGLVFMYQSDMHKIQEHPQAFEAFISALVVYLDAIGQTEPRPRDFPKGEGWIAVPKVDPEWSL